MLVDGHGVPLSLVVTGAQRHDVTQVDTVLDAVVLERPQGTRETPMRLYADKGYIGKRAHDSMLARQYLPCVIPREWRSGPRKLFPDIAPAAG